jgi:hypothetical protein
MKRLILWLMQSQLYKYLLKHVIPYIRFTTYYTKMKGYQYHEGYKLLRPGHIILTKDEKKLTGLLIPGDWDHAAFCVGKGDGYEVAQMVHDGYEKAYFFDICKESDRVAILECVDFDEEYVKKITERCKGFEGTPYDIQFTLGVKALYCSEIIYASDYEGRIKADLTDLAGLGRPYISPQGLYGAENLKVVWDSKNTVRTP